MDGRDRTEIRLEGKKGRGMGREREREKGTTRMRSMSQAPM